MSRPDPARIFSALGDPVRLEILSRLDGGGEVPLGRLVEGLGVSRQAATKHLAALEAAGLAASRSVGRERRVAPRPDGLARARRDLDRIASGWEAALARLGDRVERD